MSVFSGAKLKHNLQPRTSASQGHDYRTYAGRRTPVVPDKRLVVPTVFRKLLWYFTTIRVPAIGPMIITRLTAGIKYQGTSTRAFESKRHARFGPSVSKLTGDAVFNRTHRRTLFPVSLSSK